MTFFSILETLLIGPLKLSFEFIFDIAYKLADNPGLAIIFLSLIVNILVLPLYRRADAMQEKARDTEANLHDGVAHIKKTFTGDERMMILQTYYRQNHYKPTDVLSGSVSLLLEIPFFIAAYQFLSHLDLLQGVPFGPITDLGAPDGLLSIGGISINLLPILMTLVNVVSSTLYLKGFPLKTKVQLYGIALFFLVFLYVSPACLVFYWTLNNVFSLIKNIFYKLKNPQKTLSILCAAAGLALLVAGGTVFVLDSFKKRAFVIGVGFLLLLPICLPRLKRAIHFRESKLQTNPKLFMLGMLFLTILTGLLIPSVFIAASPQEYVDISYFHNPLWYILNSLCMAAGTFLIWMKVFYWLASPAGKRFFDQIAWILCGVALVDYMFFGTNLGIISSSLQYENGLSFSRGQQLVNLLVLMVTAALLYLCAHKWRHATANVLVISIIALCAMSAWNMVTINASVNKVSTLQLSESKFPHFQLSTTGQNVIVFMLDRSIGEYIPYIFNEKPELKKQFKGFTYYENVISFGHKTNYGSPSLFGGYEYTPVELNKRNEELLASKHNEALKIMPVIFSENGYEVTVCDPPYANYQWIPDLSIFDDCPGVTAYITEGRFGSQAQKQSRIDRNYRNFFCFSVMKSMPLFLQPSIYTDGRYRQLPSVSAEIYSSQVRDGLSISTGIDAAFMKAYHVLVNLPNITKVTKDATNTFLILTNNTTHEPVLLQEPDYIPAQNVDNTEYDMKHTDRFVVNGRNLKMETNDQMTHYHSNMAAMIQLGNWFDYLQKNNVYDNTRIILVSDHGQGVSQLDELILGDNYWEDVEWYFPLLMVKDFNSAGFVTSDTFMTNADVPTLAMRGLIENPINPFTGKAINSDEKTAHDQFIITTGTFRIDLNNGNTFLPSRWASIHDNIWDKDNWTLYNEETVLDKHAAP